VNIHGRSKQPRAADIPQDYSENTDGEDRCWAVRRDPSRRRGAPLHHDLL